MVIVEIHERGNLIHICLIEYKIEKGVRIKEITISEFSKN